LEKSLITAKRSSLIMSQQDLKKAPMYGIFHFVLDEGSPISEMSQIGMGTFSQLKSVEGGFLSLY
jgi:hypothetical protein